MDKQVFYHGAKKEIKRQWKFEASVVSNISENGTVDTTTAGREYPKTGIGNVYPTDLNDGDPVIHLGSSWNDMPMGFGRSPWLCG